MAESLDLEYAVIGAICKKPNIVKMLAAILRPEDFTLSLCGSIFQIAADAAIQGKPLDAPLLADAIKEQHDNPHQFLADCMDYCPSLANAEVYAKHLRANADNRRLREAVREALDGDSSDLAADLAAICTEQIQARPMFHAQQLRGALESAYGNLWNKEQLRIDTGYGQLDRILKGFHAGEFVLVGARPSVGKSAFGLSLAETAARHGYRVALFSLEMLADEISERMMARHTETATLDDLIDRPLPEIMGEDVARAMCEAAALPITIFDSPRMTVSRMRAQALTVPDLSLIVVDYLGLMNSERRFDSRYGEMTEISRNLKNLAVELRIPIVALSQLNREKDATDKPSLRDFRDSGSLEQDANKVMLLWNVDMTAHIVGCSVAKNRRGRTGEVHFMFDGDHMRFHELDRLHTEPPKVKEKTLAWDAPQLELSEIPDDGEAPF